MHLNFGYVTVILAWLYPKYYMEYTQKVTHYSSEIKTEHECPELSQAVDVKAVMHPVLWT